MVEPPLDVLVVGAGLSGIAAGYYLQTQTPALSYAIVEARDAIGGTWDLFRYPGVRSDSDMYTLGYSFRPWSDERSIADGASIARYVRETAAAFGIDRHISYGHRVTRASWSPTENVWNVEIETARGTMHRRAGFLYWCSGYYDYDRPFAPRWTDMETFRGPIVYPQHWPDDLDVRGRRAVVIGSGATAVTLVPALVARGAAHVTMLQRSPTYIVSLPARDSIAAALHRLLPERAAHAIVRWKNILITMLFYQYSRRAPERVKARIKAMLRDEVGASIDVERHFSPRYDPWDQRLCLVPDSDLFLALRDGTADVVTATIDRFTPEGIVLDDGTALPADIVVSATGLNLRLLGGATIDLDGTPVETAGRVSYKGMMLDGVPNLALAIGYTNASWTLKCELTSRYVCRILRHMRAGGFARVTPRAGDGVATDEPVVGLTAGYVQRARPWLPKQGARRPWKMHHNYALDTIELRFGSVEDGALVFEGTHARA